MHVLVQIHPVKVLLLWEKVVSHSMWVMRQPSTCVLVVVSVSVVLDFQRAVIEYIDSSAGKQVGISIIRFSIRVGGEVRLKDIAVAVGIVFVAFDDTICDTDYYRFTLIPVSSRV